MKYKKRQAFTMAEVLITIGIIGVVVAMTLPNLVYDYKDKVDVAKLKKIYSILQQANVNAVNKHGDVSDWIELSNAVDYISAELKTVEHYQKLYDLYNMLDYARLLDDSHAYNSILWSTPGVMLDDGSVIGFLAYKQPEGTSFQACFADKKRYCYWMLVDINGKAKPNKYGYDVFVFNVFGDNRVRPATTLKRCTPTYDSSTDGHPNGESCATWVLLKDNMDYKKCIKGNMKYCDTDYDILSE